VIGGTTGKDHPDDMIESASFIFGIGFSILVYFTSIKRGNYRPFPKALYTILSTIGITGMVWLCGVLIAHFLRKMNMHL
jgi:ABC-type antimicrobial peptide transport system permease subunit